MGTKGGTRLGAGRPGHRLKAEQTLTVDIRLWKKRGYLVNGQSINLQWSRAGVKTGSISAFVGSESIQLQYTVQGQDASQTIKTTTTPCHYGGTRPWFECPVCRGRAAVLFMRVGRFACRKCQKVSYSSQSGSSKDRELTRYHQLHALIKAGKPKGQRWKTFERLEDRFERVSERVNRSLQALVQRLQAGRY